MIRKALFILVLVLGVALPVSAQIVTVQTFHSVSGVDYAEVGRSMRIKLHNVSTGGDYWGISDQNGISYIGAPAGDYQAYLWDPYQYLWGSSEQPDPNLYHVYATRYQQFIQLTAFPRPLAPNLVAPCNYCGVPQGNFDLVWTNGLDAARTAPNWTVTYEIWDSATPVGWPQGQEWLAVPDAPCNPDGQGQCHYHVGMLNYEPGAEYTWRIVVKINYGGGIVYKTSGPVWHCHQYS
jgi:hypothetical protein